MGDLSETRSEGGTKEIRIIIIQKVSDPFRRLSELIGDVVYDEGAERWLLGEAQQPPPTSLSTSTTS
ncbi:MAG: hypothetical protein ACE5Z5_03000 [Candidatus Bathyarchaeia archaeon]